MIRRHTQQCERSVDGFGEAKTPGGNVLNWCLGDRLSQNVLLPTGHPQHFEIPQSHHDWEASAADSLGGYLISPNDS